MLSEQGLKRFIIEAMQEKSPSMFSELQADGALDEVVAERANLAMEIYLEMADRARDVALNSKLSYQEIVQTQMMANKVAKDTALNEATDFPIDNLSDQDCDYDEDREEWS